MNKKSIFSNLLQKIFLLLLFILITNCGIYKKVDTRKVPVNVNERAEKNIQEGKGYRLLGNKNKGSGVFTFASSNELWRASIDLLDFTPFSNVDYSGGIIITDWFSDEKTENEYLKITVRFLSNEIRADGVNVIIHKKICDDLNKCKISKIDSTLSNEIKLAILKEAAILKENGPLADPDFKFPKRDN